MHWREIERIKSYKPQEGLPQVTPKPIDRSIKNPILARIQHIRDNVVGKFSRSNTQRESAAPVNPVGVYAEEVYAAEMGKLGVEDRTLNNVALQMRDGAIRFQRVLADLNPKSRQAIEAEIAQFQDKYRNNPHTTIWERVGLDAFTQTLEPKTVTHNVTSGITTMASARVLATGETLHKAFAGLGIEFGRQMLDANNSNKDKAFHSIDKMRLAMAASNLKPAEKENMDVFYTLATAEALKVEV